MCLSAELVPPGTKTSTTRSQSVACARTAPPGPRPSSRGLGGAAGRAAGQPGSRAAPGSRQGSRHGSNLASGPCCPYATVVVGGVRPDSGRKSAWGGALTCLKVCIIGLTNGAACSASRWQQCLEALLRSDAARPVLHHRCSALQRPSGAPTPGRRRRCSLRACERRPQNLSTR